MKIQATGELEYWRGECISTSPERLVLIVKFKEPKKIFKTKIEHWLLSDGTSVFCDSEFKTRKDYLNELERVVANESELKLTVSKLVGEHFKNKYRGSRNTDRLNKILNLAPKEIKVEVEINNE